MQLNGTRNTISCPTPTMEPDSLLLTAYKPREITACADIQQLHIGAEIDLAVIVLGICSVSGSILVEMCSWTLTLTNIFIFFELYNSCR